MSRWGPAKPAADAGTAEASPQKTGAGQRHPGIVKSWAKGFGFIKRENGQKDVFVHQTQVKKTGFRSLMVGEAVEFDIETKRDGRQQAVNVTGPNGAEPKGQPRQDLEQQGAGGYQQGGAAYGAQGYAPQQDYNAQPAYGQPQYGAPQAGAYGPMRNRENKTGAAAPYGAGATGYQMPANYAPTANYGYAMPQQQGYAQPAYGQQPAYGMPQQYNPADATGAQQYNPAAATAAQQYNPAGATAQQYNPAAASGQTAATTYQPAATSAQGQQPTGNPYPASNAAQAYAPQAAAPSGQYQPQGAGVHPGQPQPVPQQY